MIAKIVGLFVCFVIYSYLSIGVHEQMHALTAKVLGLDGYVSYGWDWSWFHLTTMPTDTQALLVARAGGIITSAIFAVLWLIAHWQSKQSDWELDDAAVLLAVAVWQFVYAWFDGGSSAGSGSVIGAIAGISVATFIYGKPTVRWIEA